MFYLKDVAESHFSLINGRPELKILIPSYFRIDFSIVTPGGDWAPFGFPNPKPFYKKLLAKNSPWHPFRISFTNEVVLVSFQNRGLMIPPETSDVDIYDTRDHSVSRFYWTYPTFSKGGVQFVLDLYNTEDTNIDPIETYTVRASSDAIVLAGETADGKSFDKVFPK